MKLIRLIFEGSLPSWVSSKAPDLTLCSYPLKVPSNCISFLLFTKAMEEISPVLELLPKAEIRKNTLAFAFCPPSDFLLVLLIGQTQPQARWHGSLDQISDFWTLWEIGEGGMI